MEKLSAFIVKHKLLILGIMIIITIASLVCMFLFVNVNSDLLEYLPEDQKMTIGMNKMKDIFDMQGDAIVGVSGVNYEEMDALVTQIGKEQGIKPGGVIWIGMFEQMRGMDIEEMLNNIDTSSLPSFAKTKIEEYKKAFKDFDSNKLVDEMMKDENLLNIFFPDYKEIGGFQKDIKATYLVMLQLNVPTSSDEAMDLVKKIDDVILKDVDHAIGGSTKMTKDIFDSTIGEIWKYLIVAVLVMFVILMVSTTSLIEPFIFMLTLGISIIINMGTNAFLPSVSVVTFAASSILQLGLSMDYAIFLMHSLQEERKKTLDINLAMKRAIPKTFATVTASALTTVGGFLALFFMKFKIGQDLGIVLAKGVFLSLLTVIFLQPCLMLMTSKWHDKTAHKIHLPKFKTIASFSVTHRKTICIIAFALLIPAIIMQQFLQLSYIKFISPKENPTHVENVVNSMSNSVIVIVPAKSKTDNQNFINDVEKIDKVKGVMGAYGMFPEEPFHKLLEDVAFFTTIPGFDKQLPEDAKMLTGFINKGMTMYTIMIDCEPESVEATKALKDITTLLDNTFGNKPNTYFITGMAQAVEDLKVITPIDFMVVNIVSIILVMIILLIALRSLKLSTLLIAVIELGIFINLSICFIFGQEINFMAYIITSSIQLGATIDYAILYTLKYQKNLDIMPAKEAAYKAVQEGGTSVLTSVAIMTGCCLSVSLITTNVIVSEITLMIARGSVISGVLVLLLLPALLVVFTGNKRLKKRGKAESKIFRRLMKKKDKELLEAPTTTE